MFSKECHDCKIKLGPFYKKHKVLIEVGVVTLCTRCKDIRFAGKRYVSPEIVSLELEKKQIEETQSQNELAENQEKLDLLLQDELIEDQKILELLLQDELIINFSKKYSKICLTLSIFTYEKFNPFTVFKPFIFESATKFTNGYTELVKCLTSKTIDKFINFDEIDLQSVSDYEYSSVYYDYAYEPKGYDFIKFDFLQFNKDGDIDNLNKIAQWVLKKYGNIHTEVLYTALHQLASNWIKLEITNNIRNDGSKEAYYTYFIDNNPIVFNNKPRYWYKRVLKLNTEVLSELKLLEENDIDLFMKELKDWKKEMELETFKRQLIIDNIKRTSINEVDLMGGIEFEHFIGSLLEKMGYSAEVTKASGDQGADLIVKKNNLITVVQTKCYSGSVSNTAIQEVVASIKFYNADGGMVITNSLFTKSAVELADSNDIRLIDRDRLIELLDRYEV